MNDIASLSNGTPSNSDINWAIKTVTHRVNQLVNESIGNLNQGLFSRTPAVSRVYNLQLQWPIVDKLSVVDTKDWHSILLSDVYFRTVFYLNNNTDAKTNLEDDQLTIRFIQSDYPKEKESIEKLRKIVLQSCETGKSNLSFLWTPLGFFYFEQENDIRLISRNSPNMIASLHFKNLSAILETLHIPHEKSEIQKQFRNFDNTPDRVTEYTIHWPSLQEKQPQSTNKV